MTAEVMGRELGMPKSTALEISAICGVFILLALWGIVWDFTSGLLTSGIDGIMLLFVCAMMAGIFFLIMLMELTKSGIIPTPAFLRPAPKPAAAAKPAAAPAAKAPAAAVPAATAPKPSAPAAVGAPKPPSSAATTAPAAPPIAPRPAAQTPAAAPVPAKPETHTPATPKTVPEK
jgi:predicted lipid-binding transport protein (Tim44 family)